MLSNVHMFAAQVLPSLDLVYWHIVYAYMAAEQVQHTLCCRANTVCLSKPSVALKNGAAIITAAAAAAILTTTANFVTAAAIFASADFARPQHLKLVGLKWATALHIKSICLSQAVIARPVTACSAGHDNVLADA